MTHALLFVCLLLPVTAEERPPDAFFAMGLRQLKEGDFEAAVFTLDTVVRKLVAQGSRSRDLASAYVHLGAAYVGLDNQTAAKGKFREALNLDPGLRLDPKEFPPNVIKVFETQLLKKTVERRKRGARTALILGGVGAAGAVGVAAATSGGEALPPPNSAPVATVGVAPIGQAIVSVTRLTFTAAATDPDGDALSYAWTFGDGSSASGESVTHVFGAEGVFRVMATVSDARGASTTAAAEVTVRSLSGRWDENRLNIGPLTFSFFQHGAQVESDAVAAGSSSIYYRGELADPRKVVMQRFSDSFVFGLSSLPCMGEVDPSLDLILCTRLDGVGAYRLTRH